MMVQEVTTRCEAKVSTSKWGIYSDRRCRNDAKVERDDAQYCKTHDPERIEQRRTVRSEANMCSIQRRLARYDARRVGYVQQVMRCRNAESAEALVAEIITFGAAIRTGR